MYFTLIVFATYYNCSVWPEWGRYVEWGNVKPYALYFIICKLYVYRVFTDYNYNTIQLQITPEKLITK